MPSTSIAEQVPQSPSWSSPALERPACTSVPQSKAHSPTISRSPNRPVLQQTLRRLTAKARRRDLALLILLVAAVVAGWQLAAWSSISAYAAQISRNQNLRQQNKIADDDLTRRDGPLNSTEPATVEHRKDATTSQSHTG